MSLINSETKSSKRAADPLYDLRNKPFSEWTPDPKLVDDDYVPAPPEPHD